jgi:hypothetical protein
MLGSVVRGATSARRPLRFLQLQNFEFKRLGPHCPSDKMSASPLALSLRQGSPGPERETQPTAEATAQPY